MTIEIKTPATIEEYNAVEWLQAEIWGEPIGVVPTHLLLTFVKEGGLVLLMTDNGAPVGFAFGFPAPNEAGNLKLASHQAGVLPSYQSQGWGYRLKLAQREAALALNFDHMTWTFDPLQGRNARLNLHKLGTVCNTYFEDFYGAMTDPLNAGLPSDRFRVDWWLTSRRVRECLPAGGVASNPAALSLPLLNPSRPAAAGLRLPPNRVDLALDASGYRVEIPADLDRLKQAEPEAALRWRLQTRDIFQTMFAAGYTVTDLLRHENRSFYLLQNNP